MELPRFDNSVPRDRFAPTRSAPASSAAAETEAPFANLFVRREGEAESSRPQEDEPPEAAAETTTAVAVPSEPPAEAQAADAPDTDQDKHRKEERPQETAASDDTQAQTATAPIAVADPDTVESAEAGKRQVADDTALLDSASESNETEPALSSSHAGSHPARTESVAAPKISAATTASDVPTAADATAAQHETTTDVASPKQKQKQKRTQPDAGKNEHVIGKPAGGKGHQAPQAITSGAAPAAAVGNLADHSIDQQLTAGKLGQEPGSETTELRTTNDPNGRAAPSDKTAEHLLTRATARSDSGRDISQVERMQLIQRVARAIHAAPLRGGIIRLRLRPPELGSLHLEVSMDKGSLTARLETETQMARSVLLEHLPQLRERLAEQGIRIEQFDVNVSQQDTGQSQQQADQTHDPSAAARLRSRSVHAKESTDDQIHVAEATRIINPRNLNVVI